MPQALAERVEISLEDVLVLGDLVNDFQRNCCVDFGRMKPKNKSSDDSCLIFERSERQIGLQTAKVKPELF